MKTIMLCALLLAGTLHAGAQTVTVSGRVTDGQTGKPLTNAHVRVDRHRQITDSQGAFALQLSARESTCEVDISYVGYVPQKFVVSTLRDTVIFVSLKPGYHLPDVQVYAPRHDFGVEHVQMSAMELPMTQVRSLPALFGETDVMKALQRLPGVQEAGDGKAGIHVRGGNYDENLITVDGATLYNAEHLDGFVSALNADMVDNVLFYKGAFPARYGSRLSSMVDVGMREGDYQGLPRLADGRDACRPRAGRRPHPAGKHLVQRGDTCLVFRCHRAAAAGEGVRQAGVAATVCGHELL